MKILVVSDLHLEFGTHYRAPLDVDYDVVVLAGDIDSPGVNAVHWAADPATFVGRPVLIVPGNHEFYKTEMRSQLLAMRRAAIDTKVQVLDRDRVVINGVKFLGATLWTDFAMPIETGGDVTDYDEQFDIGRALEHANRALNDFRLITVEDPGILRHQGDEIQRRRLTAEDTLAMHHVARDWLRRELELGHAGPTVVVTHHGPHRKSVAAQYRRDWLTPAFASELPADFFEGMPMWINGRQCHAGGPALWIHGHTHTGFDYQVGACRVVANPRGYPLRRGRHALWENPNFHPACVIEVA